MLVFDEKERVMTWKVVYYGPALSGKTTNLLNLHDQLSESERSRMMQLDTKQDRTLFFDLLPFHYRTRAGARLNIKIFTVPGQVQYNATRKLALMRADAVLFIADSQKSQSLHNSESFMNLEANARQVGLSFDSMPLVIQYNKRDLPPEIILSEETALEKWERAGIPLFFASALYGKGVMETFEAVIDELCAFMEERYRVSESFGLVRDDLMAHIRAKNKNDNLGNFVARR